MKEKLLCKKENAYMSLEAAFVMPVVFLVILFLIYVGFYQYDKCILQQDVFRMLLRANQQKFVSNEEVVEKIKETEAEWYYDKYFLCRFTNKSLEVDYKKIHIGHEAELNVTNVLTNNFANKYFWNIKADFACARIRPEETIRNCRKLEKLAERK